MMNVYAANSHAIVFCYDSTRPNTFDAINALKDQIKSYSPAAPIMLLSLKNDLLFDEGKSIQQALLPNNAKEIGATLDFEVSAKEDTNVQAAFIALSKKLALSHKKEKEIASSQLLRIHTAMHNAQKSYLQKKPYAWKDKAAATNLDTVLDEMDAYAGNKSHSHTAKAKELHEKYPAWDEPTLPNHKEDKKSLIIDARAFLQSKNGLFKKPARDLSLMSLDAIEAIPKEKPDSCTGILVRGLDKPL